MYLLIQINTHANISSLLSAVSKLQEKQKINGYDCQTAGKQESRTAKFLDESRTGEQWSARNENGDEKAASQAAEKVESASLVFKMHFSLFFHYR